MVTLGGFMLLLLGSGDYFGGVERGERNLTFFVFAKICAGLNCDVATVTIGIPYPPYPREPLRAGQVKAQGDNLVDLATLTPRHFLAVSWDRP
jgi:hypothetical protein